MELSTHKVEVVPVELELHPNADTLSIVKVFGYTAVVKTEQWKDHRVGAYIPPDSVVPDSPEYAFLNGHFRIKARRYCGVMSQGLLMPVPLGDFQVGDDVAEVMGVTHYVPPEEMETAGDTERPPLVRKKRRPTTCRGWLRYGYYHTLRWLGLGKNKAGLGGEAEDGPVDAYPIYDVDSLYRYPKIIGVGEEVVVTEKLDGANARYVFLNDRMYCGSHRQWKKEGPNLWWGGLKQNPWIETFCRAHPGMAIYGEVIPLSNDKGMRYGCDNGQVRVYCFDLRVPGGAWIDFDTVRLGKEIQLDYGILWWAPIIYEGPFDLAQVKQLADGPSLIPRAGHAREGVVIRPVKERRVSEIGRVQLKAVSSAYLADSKDPAKKRKKDLTVGTNS